ncbi:MAG: hypothetical protein ACH34X_06475 [Thiolinea sp.]
MKKKLILLLGMTVLGTTTMLVTTSTANAHYVPPKYTKCGCVVMTYTEPAFIW